jgi:hypothetical protein
MALTAIRCGAQNSVAIGGTSDITGLEVVGGSVQNDPERTIGGKFCCVAQHGFGFLTMCTFGPRLEG